MDFEQYDFYEETPDKPKESPFDELNKLALANIPTPTTSPRGPNCTKLSNRTKS